MSYEKLITDIEVLQMVAELCHETKADDSAIGLDALAEVEPGGHFFAAQHTLSRYQTEFYEPLVADWSNFGTWTEKGGKTATERATGIWQNIVDSDIKIDVDGAKVEELESYITKKTAAGGAPPES